MSRVERESAGATVPSASGSAQRVQVLVESALSAAIAAQRALRAFNRTRQLTGNDALCLKIGIHAGPCLAVTLNERLDYFGNTVNAAARIQKLSAPGEVLFTAEVDSEVKDRKLLQEFRLVAESVVLRGLEERAFSIYRIRP